VIFPVLFFHDHDANRAKCREALRLLAHGLAFLALGRATTT
jgi:hypothetical protein